MLDYEWGSSSSMLLPGEEITQDSDQTRPIFDQYNQAFAGNFLPQANTSTPQDLFQHQQQQNLTHLDLYDSRYTFSYPPPPSTTFTPESIAGPTGFMVTPKNEEVLGQAGLDFSARIGLNLGGRTYFSSEEDDFINRLYRRSRPLEPGSSNMSRCQAEGCNADLTHAKHYHRRHKVCEFHSKTATVMIGGLTQRFCQQCSRFHLLSEFDQGKRSCRKRLADHNRRRRKSQTQPQQQQQSPSEIPAKKLNFGIWGLLVGMFEGSPPESGTHSSSSVTLAVSPPRMSLGCFRPTHYQASASSSSSSSLF